MRIVKNIARILTIAIIVLGISSFIYTISPMFFLDGTQTKPLTDVISISLSTSVIYSTIFKIIFVWICYWIVKLLYLLYKKLSNKWRKVFVFSIIILVVLFIAGVSIRKDNEYHNKNIRENLRKAPDYNYYFDNGSTYYFMHKCFLIHAHYNKHLLYHLLMLQVINILQYLNLLFLTFLN